MEKGKYKLCLYVAGESQKSNKAIENLERYCQEHLEDGYTIEIIDLRQHPHLAEKEQIIATPTLIKMLPDPIRVLIGDLSDKHKFLIGMNIISE